MTSDGPASPVPARETAASYMVTHIPRATRDTAVAAVIDSLLGQKFECAETIFVTDAEGRLEGIVRIDDLLANGGHRIAEIMEPGYQAVRRDTDQEQMALLAIRLNMVAVPVVDDDEKLIGAVPPEALFKILRAEHMEDLQRIAGIAAHERGPTVALDAPLRDRFRRRMPWLIVGLLASSVITFVMAGFERSFAARVEVAFFIPALVYISGAIGTQAVSVAVRGLSDVSITITRLIRDELLIGTVISASLGLIAFTMVFLAFGEEALAAAVGLSVLFAGAVSAVVGFGLPWVFTRLGSDPALGSGPLCAIFQDVSSLLIYSVLVGVLIV